MWYVVRSATEFGPLVKRILSELPNAPFYGFIRAGLEPNPRTLAVLEAVVEQRFIAVPRERSADFPLGGIFCVGGELLRAIGDAPFEGFHDAAWLLIARDFSALREVDAREPLPNNEWFKPDDAGKNAFATWRDSDERVMLNRSIGAKFNVKISVVNMRKVRLCVCFCARDYQLDLAFSTALEQSIALLAQYGATVYKVMNAGSSHIGKARERLLWNAMRFEPTHIWFVDTDMGWEDKVPLRLIASDHDFAAVVGVKKTEPVQWCVNTLPDPQRFHEQSNFIEVAEVGFGFVIFKAEIVQKLIDAYPELAYSTDDGKGIEHALFFDMIDGEHPVRQRFSEDLSFCRRWRKIGGQIFVDHESALIHAGRKEYTGKLKDALTEVNEQMLAQERIPGALKPPAPVRDLQPGAQFREAAE